MSCGSGLLEIKTGMIIAHGRVMEAIFNLLFVTKPHMTFYANFCPVMAVILCIYFQFETTAET